MWNFALVGIVQFNVQYRELWRMLPSDTRATRETEPF